MTVRIELDNVSNKLLLTEAISADDVVQEISPEPVETMRIDGVLYVSWDLAEPTAITLEYTTTVPESAADGATVPFEGTVILADETRPIGGQSQVEVVTDFFEWRLLEGTVTHEDIELAGQYVDRGDLTRQQYERLLRTWQRDSAATPIQNGEHE